MLMSLWKSIKDTISWKHLSETKSRNILHEHRRRKDKNYPCSKRDLESIDDQEILGKGTINAKIAHLDISLVNLTKKLEAVCIRVDKLDQKLS